MEIVEARTLGGAWLEVARAASSSACSAASSSGRESARRGELGSSPGRLVLHVKTAHVYEPELELMRGLTSSATPGP